jgi:hypothetical protein
MGHHPDQKTGLQQDSCENQEDVYPENQERLSGGGDFFSDMVEYSKGRSRNEDVAQR